jgi:hypothetical protein
MQNPEIPNTGSKSVQATESEVPSQGPTEAVPASAVSSQRDGDAADPSAGMNAARAPLKDLLDAFGITAAVIVDDEAYDVDFSDVYTLVDIHKEAVRDAFGPVSAEFRFDVPELLREAVETEWNRLPRAERLALFGRLARLQGEVAHTHARFASHIRDLLPVPCTVLTPKEWLEREDEFVKDAIKQRAETGEKWCSTLLLFDLDLEKSDFGKNGGATLALGVIAKYQDVDILCGIVSSLVHPDDEGAALADAPPDFDHARVVRIAKGDLPEKPTQFIYGVKRALLTPHVVKLRQVADTIIAESHAAATERFKRLEIYDVAYAVITRSDEEGVRDFDTFFRIHDVFYRDELRQRAHASNDLTRIAAELRHVSALAPGASKPTDRRTWQLQRREIYDNVRDINRLHLPVELGDVFACDGHDKVSTEYVVLAQPCDLMVRTGTGTRRAGHVLVAKISRTKPEKVEGESLGSFRLPYYFERDHDAWVKFGDHYTVPAWVLDLCVYNEDGRAVFLENGAAVAGLSAAWVKRATSLKADVEKALKRIVADKQPKKLKDGEVAPLLPMIDRVLAHPFVVASARTTPLALEVRCQRVQRVLPPYAADMLTKFGHYLSRTAFEADLGQGTLE